MKTEIHLARHRGKFSNGWLQARYSFSFGEYFNPNRIGVGKLRVLNDDKIQPSSGFATHGHKDMEIVTIVLEGAIAHEDSEGNKGVIRPGEIQLMSAGSGIRHSEVNPLENQVTNLLQIWIEPEKKSIPPGYQDLKYELKSNQFTKIVSPKKEDNTLNICQQAMFYLGKFEEEKSIDIKPEIKDSVLFLFVIDGSVKVEGDTLNPRDAVVVKEWKDLKVHIKENTFVLLIESAE